jgi:hypothetical protein
VAVSAGLMDFAIEKSDVDMLAKLYEGGHWYVSVHAFST